MGECFKCGISDEKALLFNAVSGKGIVKICRKCNYEEKLPLIKKPGTEEIKKRQSVYERLSSLSGVDEDYKKKFADQGRKEILAKQETTLREIVDKNYKKKIPEERKPQTDLIDNFHWILMRARRLKKLTQKQLAEEIAEPEAAIKMAENGVLPEDSFNLINKLENFLGVRISKKQRERVLTSSYSQEVDVVKQEIKDRFKNEVRFDDLTTKTLTISDLQEMKDRRKEERGGKRLEEPTEDKEEKEKLEDKRDLTDEEMNEIIFGKR